MKTNRFKYLIAAIMPIIAIAGPLYAQQKSETVSPVSSKTTAADDDNETTKPNAYQLFGYGDPKLDSISKQADHYSKLVYSYNHNNTYETLNARAKGFSKSAPSFYDNDTLRHLMAGVNKISQYFKSHLNRDLYLKRDSLGRLVGDYFKTKKFATINSGLQTKYHIDPVKNYSDNNADYRQYHDELFKKMPVAVKQELQELKTLSEQVRDQFKSPEYAANVKQLPLLIDSMKSYYKTPHIAQYTYASYEATMDVPADQKRKAQDDLIAYIKNPEYKHASDLWTEYAKKMRDYYISTPLVKEREDAWKNELKTILGDDYDVILHPAHGIIL